MAVQLGTLVVRLFHKERASRNQWETNHAGSRIPLGDNYIGSANSTEWLAVHASVGLFMKGHQEWNVTAVVELTLETKRFDPSVNYRRSWQKRKYSYGNSQALQDALTPWMLFWGCTARCTNTVRLFWGCTRTTFGENRMSNVTFNKIIKTTNYRKIQILRHQYKYPL